MIARNPFRLVASLYFSLLYPALAVLAAASASDSRFFEIDLRDIEASTARFPPWLREVAVSDGEFDPDRGWHVPETRGFGQGALYLSLDRDQLEGDLALTLLSSTPANFAVQLMDDEERLIAVDLLANRQQAEELWR